MSCLKWKISCCVWFLPTTKAEAQCLMNCGGNTSWYRYFTLTHLLSDLEATCGALHKRRLWNRLCRLLCHWNHNDPADPWYLKCHWQVEKLFGVAGRPPCYWAVVKTEWLTVGQQVTIFPKHELGINLIHWVMKLDILSNSPSVNGDGTYVREPKQTQKAQVNYIKKLPRCHVIALS